MRKQLFLSAVLFCLLSASLVALPTLLRPQRASAATQIFASPIQGGCYIAAPNDCRLHVDPFTIYLATGTKLVSFQLQALPSGGSLSVIYDFKPDISNPVPFSGSSYAPSLVTQDFAATCGKTYSLWLIGQDSGDPNPYVLGGTDDFTCPAGVP